MNAFPQIWKLLRRLRPVHWFNNLKHWEKLRHNRSLYQRLGLRKSVVASIAHRDLAQHSGDLPWLDQPGGMEALEKDARFQAFSPQIKAQLRQWVNHGFMVLEGLIPETTIDQVNDDVQRIIREKLLPFHYTNTRVMNCIRHSDAIREVVKHPQVMELLAFIMQRDVRVFQTMNFLNGSGALAHADAIHMTTEPLGNMAAIWVALEDIHPDSGPVFYHPGSHRLPYVMNQAFDTGNTSLWVGDNYYENYTDHIREVLASNDLPAQPFLAKKGDILVWHANLLHGGEAVKDPDLTRKSLVAHYFAEGVLCYHEITERPAILEDF